MVDAAKVVLPKRAVALPSAVAAGSIILLTVLYGGVLHAQEGLPVIRLVEPGPPGCVLLDSPNLGERTLTIVGENFGDAENGKVQFRRGGIGDVSARFGTEVDWESSTRITVDMARVREHLWGYKTLSLNVRVSTDRQPHGLWSREFFVATNESACPGMIPAPTPAPRPRHISFPPTLPVRGVSGDLWADVVLGKPSFSEIGPEQVVPFKVFNPGGVVVDRSVEPGRAYVWDAANSRILGIDLADCYEGPSPCTAEVVLGQPSGFDQSGCNRDGGDEGYPVRPAASAETLCGIANVPVSPAQAHSYVTMAVAPSGDLYVPDSFNHRVLKYESPFESDAVADAVWGQSDFSGMLCNGGKRSPTAETLCFHSSTNRGVLSLYGNGVNIDSDGNLWVADGGNNRVLRFPMDASTGKIAKRADLVLGQPDFVSARKGGGASQLHAPSAVRVSNDGWVFVADTVNDRVVVYKPPLKTGMSLDMVLGSDLHKPNSIEIDPSGEGVWVQDSGNRMVELWDWEGRSVLRVLGKRRFLPDRRCGNALNSLPGLPHMCPSAGGIGIDSEGNVLVSVSLTQSDVIRFHPPTSAAGGRRFYPDRRLFYPPARPNMKGPRGIRAARGVAVWRDQLIVSDIGRLMFWNGLDTLSNGRPADGIVGDESYVDVWRSCCGRIKADSAGRLWALSFEGIDFLDVYELPLTERSVPVHSFWKADTSITVLGTGERISLGHRVFGIAPAGGGEFLWLSDTDNHRVLRIRDPMTDPVVDVILGQLDPTGTTCNRGEPEGRLQLDTLCFPGALSIDRLGNLFVSDHALQTVRNFRMLVFPPELFPSDHPSAVFASRATKAFYHSSNDKTPHLIVDPWVRDRPSRVFDEEIVPWHVLHAATWEPAFDSSNRMVVGFNAYKAPRFVGYYDDPIGRGRVLPTSYLYDFGSMPYTATFDDDDNLYVGDINRGRVIVYRDPFDNPARPVAQSTPAPLPQYQVAISSLDPSPPYCVVRWSRQERERTLTLTVEELPLERGLGLEFRRVTDRHVDWLGLSAGMVQENRIVVDMSRHETGRERGRRVLTVRIVGPDREPLSNWSPAFLLAETTEACGIALTSPIPSPTPTPMPVPTPTPAPTRTPTPTPTTAPVPVPPDAYFCDHPDPYACDRPDE